MGGKRLTKEQKLTISREHRNERSNREIAGLLEDEDGNGPDQSTVARYVRQLPHSPLDEPFEWNKLTLTGAPWEASEWLLECQFSWVHYGGSDSLRSMLEESYAQGVGQESFTNRWASWCWRVHQADPNLDVDEVVGISRFYSYADELEDLLPDEPPIDIRWLDALLLFRPYDSKDNFDLYRKALISGQVHAAQGFIDAIEQAEPPKLLIDVIESVGDTSTMSVDEHSRFVENWSYVLLWLGGRTRKFGEFKNFYN